MGRPTNEERERRANYIADAPEKIKVLEQQLRGLHKKGKPIYSDDALYKKYEALRAMYKQEGMQEKSVSANEQMRMYLKKVLSGRTLKSDEEKRLTLNKYYGTFLYVARDDFHSFLVYMERYREPKDQFYMPRIHVLRPIVQDLQDLADGKLDVLGISMCPGSGKTTLGIFYLTWRIGREPERPALASGHSGALTQAFYIGVLNLISSPEYTFKEIFPEIDSTYTNAKNGEIDLIEQKRIHTFTAVSIDGTLTGRARCETILYADDLVSGIEEAMNRDRMETLWMKYTNDLKSRKKEGCSELHIATRWSVHDVLGRIEALYEGNPRAKFVKLPALNELGESNFEYKYGKGFSKEYFEEMRSSMDKVSFECIYQQQPMEREGLVFHEEDLRYFFDLPSEKPDAIVAACDSKKQGMDYVAMPVGYVYGDAIYIPDLVFNNGLPAVTKPLVANAIVRNRVSRADFEMNNGGDDYAEDVEVDCRKQGWRTSFRVFYTNSNKITKIMTQSDYIIKHFVFLHPSRYKKGSEYDQFMRNLTTFVQTGKSKHDDAPDVCAMLAELVKDLSGNQVQIIDRRKLPF